MRRLAKYEARTRPTPESVDEFLERIPDEAKRTDCQRLRDLMASASGDAGSMWGTSMIGFGAYHYRYASGHEGDTMAVGFAPRAANIVLYITGGFEEHANVLQRLGKHKTGKGCLYIKRLSDVDEGALTELIQASVARAAEANVERN